MAGCDAAVITMHGIILCPSMVDIHEMFPLDLAIVCKPEQTTGSFSRWRWL